MGSFHGYSFLTMFFFFFFFFFFIAPLSTFGWSSNPSVDLSSRSELVELAGYGEEKLSSVLVTGSVLCEACLGAGGAEKHSLPVSGALVGISCKTGRRKMKLMNWVQERTDEYGEFMIDLPSHLHAIPYLDKACIVEVLRMPKNSSCKRGPVGKPKGLKLSSVGNNIRTYTVGSLRLQFQRGACVEEAK